MGVRTFLVGTVLAGLAVAVAGCGGGGSGTADDEPAPTGPSSSPTSSCPSFAAVEDTPDADGVYQRFIVGLDQRLQDDADARGEVLRRVGEELCLTVTQTDPRLTRAVVVDVGRPLDAAGQARVVAAFEKVDGVAYAEPDVVVSLDGPGGGTAQ
jgi:hypothetical protein